MPFAPLPRLPGQSIHEYRLMLARINGLRYGIAPRAEGQTDKEYYEIVKVQCENDRGNHFPFGVFVPGTSMPVIPIVVLVVCIGLVVGMLLGS
jgi:hypothetical protein